MILPKLKNNEYNDENNTIKIINLINQLNQNNYLEEDAYLYILDNISLSEIDYLFKLSRHKTDEVYGKKVFIRGLIEYTNYCNRGCLYCGINASNQKVNRYRLTMDEILECVKLGYNEGIRSFVIQGGEDPYFNDERMIEIIKNIKSNYSDCALTLSIGEKSRETYQKYYDVGCDRYLLRHETASKTLYEFLHPKWMSFENRMRCLKDLKEIGFQTGAGFMVNSPNQTNLDLVKDLKFIELFKPHMCGIGPFIAHHDTPFGDYESGDANCTLVMMALVRLISPTILLPSTTALGTIDANGRQKGFLAGGMVVMPNLTPLSVRKNYEIYAEKKIWGDEAIESLKKSLKMIENAGYIPSLTRGDHYEYEVK